MKLRAEIQDVMVHSAENWDKSTSFLDFKKGIYPVHSAMTRKGWVFLLFLSWTVCLSCEQVRQLIWQSPNKSLLRSPKQHIAFHLCKLAFISAWFDVNWVWNWIKRHLCFSSTDFSCTYVRACVSAHITNQSLEYPCVQKKDFPPLSPCLNEAWDPTLTAALRPLELKLE